MKDITRQLIVTRLEVRHRMESRYLLELAEPGTRSGATSIEGQESPDQSRL